MLVDNPIINSPFEEPSRHWGYEGGQPLLKEGRRPAGYYWKPRTRDPQLSLFEEDFLPLELVNTLRERVKEWRQRGYPGVTPITRELLRHWNNPDRERKLFFAQREAAETLIWLVEAPEAEKQGIEVPKDGNLTRYALKMATGTGKTVVMGMVIAWQVLNKLAYPWDTRFSDAVLLVCPNLTIRERLQVLLPSRPDNYYQRFDLLPPGTMEHLHKGRFQIINWHLLQPKDDSKSRSVLKRGPESDKAFSRRVLKGLEGKRNILVINDEAHHAYRPRPLEEDEREGLSEEEIKEREEATVWVSGLDRIHAARGINFCVDFSATPFYIRGSGYPEGTPFPWIVSDFGLVDAIESGMVKVPRMPVDDNTGALIPKYFRLWEEINKNLPVSERQTNRRRAKPESVLREAEGALATLASEWKKTFEQFQEANSPVPPVLIVVCDNTDLAKVVYTYIAGGNLLSELANRDGQNVTLHVDSKVLAEAESAIEGGKKDKDPERLRKTVDTVGKTEWEGEGEPPGKNIRCVISVGMLNEGWDAPNVTQILGLRAFSSQLLCEQVVGRGLRRMNYDDLSEPEYVDVYGVPFEVIPVKKKPLSQAVTVKVSTLVRALPERKALEITFPRVEGYVFDVRHRIRVDWQKIPPLRLGQEPIEVKAGPLLGGHLGRGDPFLVTHDREPYYEEKRLQAIVYEIASDITRRLKDKQADLGHWLSRYVLFPQVLDIVWHFLRQKVERDPDVRLEEVGLLKYRDQIVERLYQGIEPDTNAGEAPILPVIERFRPVGSTSQVMFRTVRRVMPTQKSHISHVVLDSHWEEKVAQWLEESPKVKAYARNDHLDFAIPYEWNGVRHEYRPDFLVLWHLANGEEVKLILEVKGVEKEQDRQKITAAERWVKAVNYHGDFGKWAYVVVRDPNNIEAYVEEALTNSGFLSHTPL